MNKVQEVFGKYAVEIKGSIVLFDTENEAISKAVLETQGAEFAERANTYLVARELDPESKMAKGRANVIKDFLAFEASQAEPLAKETDVAGPSDSEEF